MGKLFTSESVTEGHPDKLCDYISDSILDCYLTEDENAAVACEVAAGKGEIFITGEICSKIDVDIENITREAIKEIGYDDEKTGIDYRKCHVIINIRKHTPTNYLYHENNNVIIRPSEDQATVVGYACDETEELMPLPITLAHKLSRRLAEVRKNNELPYLLPDGKVQVTVEYDNDMPIRIYSIVISTQHKDDIDFSHLESDIKENVIYPVIPKNLLDNDTKYIINPAGMFLVGGPLGDSGLTGRKIIVDTYGSSARHGGGAFSGKDATKPDRTGAYMARFLAKNIVANKLAKKCEVQISYVIGLQKPISLYINTFGTSTISEDEISKIILEKFDLSIDGIINYLNLKKPIYRNTTNYGHFGKSELSWEQIINLC